MKINKIKRDTLIEDKKTDTGTVLEPVDVSRKTNWPEDVEEQAAKIRAEVQKRLKDARKVALETKGKDFVESLKSRSELAAFVKNLKENGIAYKISRSKTEGMRYDVSYLKEDVEEGSNEPEIYVGKRTDAIEGDIRPNEEQIRIGEENGWTGFELVHGYGVFQDAENSPLYIARIDDMEVFDGDAEAMEQAIKDGFSRFELTDVQRDYILKETHALPETIIDCAENHEILDKIVECVKEGKCECEDEELCEEIHDGEYEEPVSGWWINGTLKDFDPQHLVDRVIELKRSLHSNRIAVDNDDEKVIYHVTVSLMGHTLDDCYVFVDVVKDVYKRPYGDADDINTYHFDNEQERVFSKDCGEGEDKWQKAVEALNKWKAKELRLYEGKEKNESCSDKELADRLVANGSCENEKEAKKRVSRMSKETKDELCKSTERQNKQNLVNDSLKEDGNDKPFIARIGPKTGAFEDFYLFNSKEDMRKLLSHWTDFTKFGPTLDAGEINVKHDDKDEALFYVVRFYGRKDPDYRFYVSDKDGVSQRGANVSCSTHHLTKLPSKLGGIDIKNATKYYDKNSIPSLVDIAHDVGEHITSYWHNAGDDSKGKEELRNYLRVDSMEELETKDEDYLSSVIKVVPVLNANHFIAKEEEEMEQSHADEPVELTDAEFEKYKANLISDDYYHEEDELICYNDGEGVVLSFNLSDDPDDEEFSSVEDAVTKGKSEDGFTFDIMKNTPENLRKLIAKHKEDLSFIYDESMNRSNKIKGKRVNGCIKESEDEEDQERQVQAALDAMSHRDGEAPKRKARWEKTVSNHGLHDAINDADYEGIRKAAIAILKDVEEYLGDDSETYDLIDGFENLEDYDEDECDYLLGELYDLCDNVGVFIRLEESKCEESLDNERWYRGCEGVEFIWNGTQSDPELEYLGHRLNYWDIENALWDMFLEETGHEDSDSDDPEVEAEFDKFVQEHCKEYLDYVISDGGREQAENEDESEYEPHLATSDLEAGQWYEDLDDAKKASAKERSKYPALSTLKQSRHFDELRRELSDEELAGLEAEIKEYVDSNDDDAYLAKHNGMYPDGVLWYEGLYQTDEVIDYAHEKFGGNNKVEESLKIISDISEYEPWGGAVSHWDYIQDNNLVDSLETILEEEYPDGITMTKLNDLLWFDWDFVKEWLGIYEEEE